MIGAGAPRIAVVGAGLVGLGTARALRTLLPRARIVIIEKEAQAGAHQSTHNSGVLHAGLYYAPGSLKAKLAVTGLRMMRAFCEANRIPHEVCGKLVVAVTRAEVPRLQALLARGVANGLHGLRWLDADAAREVEPEVRAQAALWVPEEGIVDYGAVVSALVAELAGSGVEFVYGMGVGLARSSGGSWTMQGGDREVTADFVVTCGGLHSDRLARLFGARTEVCIVPFRGDYFTLKPGRAHLVRHLIYPVPDPTFPFLGVHFTRMIGGGVECGPNAVLALDREGYEPWRVRARDAIDVLRFPGLWRFVARYPQAAWFEVRRAASRRLFADSLRMLVPALHDDDLVRGPSGVRAQAMRPDGTLVEDFAFASGPNSLHVINAPSPAATASLAIGAHVAELVVDALRATS